jgi:hypothetical protein
MLKTLSAGKCDRVERFPRDDASGFESACMGKLPLANLCAFAAVESRGHQFKVGELRLEFRGRITGTM